ncbi:caspase family protein [bacterium]|nr:caspase family protein [bacterium]
MFWHDGVRRRFYLVALFVTGSVAGCGGSSTQMGTSLNGLAHSAAGRNVAVLMGAPNGLPGVPTDIVELDRVFKSTQLDLGFDEVVKDDTANTEEIFEASASAASNADTLFWYFSGHGNTGILLAEDRSFTFSEVASAITAARNNRPLERLVVMIDSCYSGSFVDGRTPIIPSGQAGAPDDGETVRSKCIPMAGAMASVDDALAEFARFQGTLYNQAFVLASSTKNETSADLGRSRGGAFTWSLRGVINEAGANDRGATIREIAERTRMDTEDVGGHTPVWRAFPSAVILGEKFFLYE